LNRLNLITNAKLTLQHGGIDYSNANLQKLPHKKDQITEKFEACFVQQNLF